MNYLWAIIFLLTIYGCVTTYFCIKFALTILRVQDSIESGIDSIEERHQSISEILSRPLFFDSPEIRKVLEDIEETRDTLHQIAFDMSAKIIDEKEDS